MISQRLLLLGAFAASFEQNQGLDSSSNTAPSNHIPILDFTLGIGMNRDIAQVTPVTSNQASLWHALDGIPFLFDRSNKRKLNKKVLVNPHSDLDASNKMHRTLVFGDYADHSFTCPLTTTCPNICVANLSDCPVDATCASASNSPDHEFELCADGTCADKTLGEECAADLETPCGCSKLSIACAKQVDLWDTCHDKFQEYYDVHHQCLEDEAVALPPPKMTAAPVLFSLCMLCVTLLMCIWCAFNQRLKPVTGSTSELENELGEKWTQTGYKSNLAGNLLYGLIILGHVSIQVLLLLTVIYYYVNYDTFNETQVLRAFTIVWTVGFVWCFLLKWPESIHSICLRRSLAQDATYVAVRAPVRKIDTMYEKKKLANMLEWLSTKFTFLMNFLYSLESNDKYDDIQYKTTFCKIETDPRTATKYFYFRMRRYCYNDRMKKFSPGRFDVTNNTAIGTWLSKDNIRNGLSMAESTWRLGLVGENVLECPKPSLIRSVIREFSHPFYLYQNFMVWSWVPLWYYYMAIVQTVVRLGGGLIVAVFHYMSDVDLYRLMVIKGSVDVVRDGTVVTIDKTDVVPGDIVRIASGPVHFDMAILQSEHLLVDESALTGEVHPVSKVALDPANSGQTYDAKRNKNSTIFAGTKILECGLSDIGLVTQTGSFTTRGQLLSDVLSFEPHTFKFHNEIKLVLAILFVEMLILVSYVLVTVQAEHWVHNFFYALYVAGTVLPPLLPTVFVVSIGISAKRLQKIGITCTDSSGILAAGKVKKAFFDKTGTLTEQGLKFVSATRGDGETRKGYMILEPLLQLGISVCHTLTLNANGDLVGPAVDRQAFCAIQNARLLPDHSISLGGVAIKYLKRFDFDHHSTTQSVVIQHGDEKMVFVKGSPEAISKLCLPSSLPQGFHDMARHSARSGLYQLAIARGTYTGDKEMHELQRSDIEKDLVFTGCINFQNLMKQESPAVISELRGGAIEPAMITGDSVLTGCYIARKTGIIQPYESVILGTLRDGFKVEWVDAFNDTPAADPMSSISEHTVLAMTGEVWRHLLEHSPKKAMELGKQTRVFGRATPFDKVSIVSTFVKYGDITMMCGDGGNDSGALKAAHVGIALSDSEASIVAPFTSLDKTITSVIEVLKEGRCALSSSFASYKYMLMYGQVETFNQVANAYFNTTFGEWCWFFMDGLWPITMAFSLPLARAAKNLSKKHPTASILSPHTLSSACGVLGINVMFLVISMFLLFAQDWYQCRQWDGDNLADFYTGDNYETSTIFVVTGYQYIASAAAFNFGFTWRRSWWRNYVFVFFFLLWTSMQFAATLHASSFSCIFRLNCTNENVVRSVTNSEPQPINNSFNTTLMPTSYRVQLVVLMIANLLLVCAWEYFIVNGSLPKAIATKLFEKTKIGISGEELRSSQIATKYIESVRDRDSDEGATSDQSDSKDAESDQIGLEAA